MKTTLFLTAAVWLATGSMVMAFSSTNTIHSPGTENGYLTIGRNVVVLPVTIQTGDKLELYNLHGARILSKTVGDGYLSENMTTVPEGMYTLVVRRGHSIVATENVPVAGEELARR